MKESTHQVVTRGFFPVFVTLILFLVISLPVAAAGWKTLSGRWHRLNPVSPPEHEVLNCGGNQIWHCRYDKHPEPVLSYTQPPDATFGRFQGQEITASWSCPDWFPSQICSRATFVVGGEMVFHLPDGTDIPVSEELIITESGGSQVLYVYWVDQFVCPWYQSFDDALAANPDVESDCTFAP